MGSAPRRGRGVGAGCLGTGGVVGQSIRVALAGALFASLGGAIAGATLIRASHMPHDVAVVMENTFTTAFHTAFLVCAIIAALGVFTSLVRGKEGRNSRMKGIVVGK